MLLPVIGDAGQRALDDACVLIVGCGALGTVVADSLARAGVGRMVIVDRDLVEPTNLQRQILFDDADARRGTPKAEAARARLAAVNPLVHVDAHVDDFNHRNALRFAADADVIVDGLDNFETRYLLNDLAVRRGLPYVYAGAVGTTGMSLTILPHPDCAAPAGPRAGRWPAAEATPCLRCLFPEPPPPGTSPTCDTAGVLGPAVMTIAAHQATQTIKLLVGALAALDRTLLSVDVWSNQHRRVDVAAARRADCPCCAAGRFEYLEGRATSSATSLCGRNAVQVAAPDGPGREQLLDLDELCRRLAAHGRFEHNGFLLRGTFSSERSSGGDPIELTLFPNGRAVLSGITEPEIARALYARYIGT
jgi:adenylyltransferase/sulfurtransferase